MKKHTVKVGKKKEKKERATKVDEEKKDCMMDEDWEWGGGDNEYNNENEAGWA